MGNIMFCIASGKYYADKNGYDFYLFNSGSHNNFLSTVKDGIFKDIKIVDEIDKSQFEVIRERSTYSPFKINTDKDVYIEGYRECPKYWNNDKEYIFKLFKPEKGIISAIKNAYNVKFSEYVCINVRRGDYEKEDVKKTLGLLKIDFFYNCMDYFPEGQKYLIVSDDIEWCKKNFVGEQYLFADKDVEGFQKMYVDLWIQTLCGHNIISNSTFSWWGAYLNKTPGRKVYYPYRFFRVVVDRNKIPQNDNWVEVPAIWDDGRQSMRLKIEPKQKELETPKPSAEEKIMPENKKPEPIVRYMKTPKSSKLRIIGMKR